MKYHQVLSAVAALLIHWDIQAQDVYQTKFGTLLIEIPLSDHILEIHTRSLKVTLDYETAYFDLELDPAILHTGIDSLDQKLIRETPRLLKLSGELGIEEINTKAHPIQHFEFTGNLDGGSKVLSIVGIGHLEHVIGGEEFACLLGLQFELEPRSILDGQLAQQVAGDIKVQLIQTVLQKVDL